MNNWKQDARKLLAAFARAKPAGIGISVDIIRKAIEDKIGSPKHHNSWGGLFMWAKQKKILRSTGEYRASSRKTNNGRKNQVYQVDYVAVETYFASEGAS